jgi:hypothetical protein
MINKYQGFNWINNNIDYKVLLHYTKKYKGGFEYCDLEDAKKADLITVFLEFRNKITNDLEDINLEKDFKNCDQGMSKAILYAEKLSKRFNTTWDQY